MADDKPIIVIKKKGGHGGHHGGAWKVAYADFVTAMMCFFMVMWLLGSASQSSKANIATYFRRPGIFTQGSGSPLMMGESGIVTDGKLAPEYDEKKPQKHDLEHETFAKGKDGSNLKIQVPPDQKDGEFMDKLFARETPVVKIEGTPDPSKTPAAEMPRIGDEGQLPSEQDLLKHMAEQVREVFRTSPELQELLGMVDVSIDSHGLNIEIIDTEKTSMFRSGSAEILPDAREAFMKITRIINTVPHKVDLVGHTDSKPLRSRGGSYTNWELSSDRANAARRLLIEAGTPPDRIGSVVGKADTELKLPQDSGAAANRRITMRVRFEQEKTVSLDKNPDLIQRLATPRPAPGASTGPGAIAPTPLSIASPGAVPSREPVLSLSAKEILNGQKKQPPVRLPSQERKPGTKEGKPRILDDSPVIKPFDILSGN